MMAKVTMPLSMTCRMLMISHSLLLLKLDSYSSHFGSPLASCGGYMKNVASGCVDKAGWLRGQDVAVEA